MYYLPACKGPANVAAALLFPKRSCLHHTGQTTAPVCNNREKKKKCKAEKRRKERLLEKACFVFSSCTLPKRFSSEHFVRPMPAAQTVCCFPLRNALLARFSACTRRMPQRTCILSVRAYLHARDASHTRKNATTCASLQGKKEAAI